MFLPMQRCSFGCLMAILVNYAFWLSGAPFWFAVRGALVSVRIASNFSISDSAEFCLDSHFWDVATLCRFAETLCDLVALFP